MKISKVGVLALLLALGALAIAGYGVQLLRDQQRELTELRAQTEAVAPAFDKFKGAVRQMGRDLTALVLYEVDLTKTGWQPIGRGFFVIDASFERQPTGMQVRGKVINTASVTHETLVFEARVGTLSATFNVAKAAPGIALPFDVLVKDVPPEAAPRAFLTLESSTISFASTSGKSPTSREHLDPDKLLR